MTEEKKELNFRDMTAKESFSTIEYTIEQDAEGRSWAVAISPKGNKAQRLVKDESREKNKGMIRRLNWLGYLLPHLLFFRFDALFSSYKSNISEFLIIQ